MKITATLPLIFALSVSTFVFAQSSSMKDMDMKEMKSMKDMDMKKCMDMDGMKDMKGMDGMKGMDMKNMDAKTCHEMMEGKDKNHKHNAALTHKADGTVKLVDTASSKVTLEHGAVKSLGWPAMTMTFLVKDKTLLGELGTGMKVHVEFNKQGSDYVINSVKKM